MLELDRLAITAGCDHVDTEIEVGAAPSRTGTRTDLVSIHSKRRNVWDTRPAVAMVGYAIGALYALPRIKKPQKSKAH